MVPRPGCLHELRTRSASCPSIEVLCAWCPPATGGRGALVGPRCTACSNDLLSDHETTVVTAKTVEYDPGFRRAVALGFLTVRQAIERGSRQHYVARIVQRHGLSVRHALLVAYNRVSLARAVRLQQPEPESVLAPAVGTGGARWLLQGAAAVALVGTLCGAVAWHEAGRVARDRDPAAPREPPPAPSGLRWEPPVTHADRSVRKDSRGRVTEVIASSPSGVLEAYCRSLRGGAKPIRLVPSGGPWRGIYSLEGRLRAITIINYPQRRCWRTGDGLGPVSETLLE